VLLTFCRFSLALLASPVPVSFFPFFFLPAQRPFPPSPKQEASTPPRMDRPASVAAATTPEPDAPLLEKPRYKVVVDIGRAELELLRTVQETHGTEPLARFLVRGVAQIDGSGGFWCRWLCR
jgi:hypothetical protein